MWRGWFPYCSYLFITELKKIRCARAWENHWFCLNRHRNCECKMVFAKHIKCTRAEKVLSPQMKIHKNRSTPLTSKGVVGLRKGVIVAIFSFIFCLSERNAFIVSKFVLKYLYAIFFICEQCHCDSHWHCSLCLIHFCLHEDISCLLGNMFQLMWSFRFAISSLTVSVTIRPTVFEIK